ncbi:MAG: DUF6249 domain-containing protein [Spartobacteria bacterium]
MKTTFLVCISSVALAFVALGQTPTPPFDPAAPVAAPTIAATPDSYATPSVATASVAPVATATVAPASTLPPVAPVATAAPAATVAPTAAPAPSPDTEEEFDKAIERKIRKHFSTNFSSNHSGGDEVPWIALPIVLIVFITIFGLPVAIVGTILYFSFSKSRAMHKTVRMMVEKGQPVPEALLNPPPVVRQRSDLRRGIILLTVGAGLVVFLGAVNDWDGGAWSIGIIPFMIGLGYLLVWRLDARSEPPSPRV